jgi:hypothetical protein
MTTTAGPPRFRDQAITFASGATATRVGRFPLHYGSHMAHGGK